MDTNMIDKQPITTLYGEIKHRDEVRLLIPLGYVPGLPILTIKNEQLVAVIPFLRYKVTGEVDRTLIFPIKYTLEYLIPEKQVVGFNDLSLDPRFADTDFEKVIGFFRHDSIKHLNKSEYAQLRSKVIAGYDMVVNSLLYDGSQLTADQEHDFVNSLRTIIEPCVVPAYQRIDNDFFNKFLN